MLGKLIKYELKATGRTFLPLYGLLLVVSLIHRFLGREDGMFQELNKLGDFITVILVAVFIALGVLTLVVTIQRFQKNLLKDEGYLMFTLPTSTRKLMISKAIVAIIWLLASMLAAVLTFLILFSDPIFFQELAYVWQQAQSLISQIGIEWFVDSFQFILFMVLGYFGFLVTIYLSLSIGQVPVFQKHRTLMSIVAFIGINFMLGWMQNFISTNLIPDTMSFSMTLLVSNVFSIIWTLGLFEVTHYILKKHLNLE